HPRWARRLLALGDRVVAPSPYLARELGHLADIEVIPNVIELDEYPFVLRGELAPRLWWMRTFHPLYHPELALEVLARLRVDHPDATLTMAGQDKGLLDATRAHAEALGVASAVRFPG